ncbi:hypothetical protein Poli38472_010288 [Pythium oligandrum]|uniref:Major facilitator superfamily (MFS) profile domain-containing protein n=1 Tax=Pythium oligandrum TaxID=41045 RepID=A0A8K1C936_PYTOL|nr:hypothetical protein Poli38472_010288 [Pythium oligandrum]|eukprot:TMW58729.1 hypothetical protein Poli38472_010288 [Pythium oligandrum]
MTMLLTTTTTTTHWLRAYVLYVVSFLDLMAVSMIIPSLASYIKGMEGGTLAFGYIMSMYGFIQFFSAPIAGSLSDVYGRRRVLLACFVGASLGYLILGASWNIYLVILSRIPPALFKHSLDIIKVAVTDGQDPETRSASIGRLNAAANAGFIIGPVVGGYVSAIPNGFNYTTLLTTAIFALNYALISFFYVDHMPTKAHDDDQDATPAEKKSVHYRQLVLDTKNKLLEFKNIIHETGPAQTLLLARLLLAMAAILYRTHFSTLLEDKFGTDPKSRGFVLSYMGVLGAFGSVAVGVVTRFVRSERLVLQVSSLIYVATFLALSHATSLRAVYILLVPQVVSISMLRASSIGLQTTFVAPERVGTFMGISSSLTSVARTVSPIMSGWTYLVSVDGPAYGAALLAGLSAAMFCFSPHFNSINSIKHASNEKKSVKD